MDSVLKPIRQSAAELTACAVSRLFPDVILVGGEATEEGFYYDFIMEQSLHEEGLVVVEEEMRRLIKEDLEVKTPEMMRENAVEFFTYHGQKVKANLAAVADSNLITLFHIGDFFDFCSPPYVTHTGQITAFKLLEIKRENRFIRGVGELQVTRFLGTAFDHPKKLKKNLKSQEKLKKRDHRILGKELDLFSLQDQVTTHSWFWHPKGTVIRDCLLDRWRRSCKNAGFQMVVTPELVKEKFLRTSGQEYCSDLLPPISLEAKEFHLGKDKSLQHAQLFNQRRRSYKELPVRFAEFGELYSFIDSAQIKGLLRSRTFSADTLTIFCDEPQFLEEVKSCLQLVEKSATILGFDCTFTLRGHGTKYAGTLKQWDKVESWMEKALKEEAFDYQRSQCGVYEGPRIEMTLIDSLSREWRGTGISVDFNLTDRFSLHYQGTDDEMHAPIMIRTSILGSLERLIAILVEHTAGKFPLWLAPEQVRVVPVMDNHVSYANSVAAMGENQGLRLTVDLRRDTLAAKIHAAAQDMVPYILIVGDAEQKNGVVTVRSTYTDKVNSRADPKAFFLELKENATT